MNSTKNDNDDDDDDGQLGFSLIMKDLLADLAVDDDDATAVANHWLSLDLLEQELQQLESTSGSGNGNSNNYNESKMMQQQQQQHSTAGMVVNSQAAAAAAAALQQQQNILQAFQSPIGLIPSVVHPSSMVYPVSQYDNTTNNNNSNSNTAMDAWSLSLQKFTASSLEADFLQADSARKSAVTQLPLVANTTTTTVAAAAVVTNFDDYNVKEPAQVTILGPPPGITPDASQQLIAQAAAKLVQQLQQQQPPAVTDHGEVHTMMDEETILANQLTRNLQLIHEHEILDEEEGGDILSPVSNLGLQATTPRPSPMTPQNSMTASLPPPTPRNSIVTNINNMNQGDSVVIASAPTPMPTPVVVRTINPVVVGDANNKNTNVTTPFPPVMATTTMSPSPPIIPVPPPHPQQPQVVPPQQPQAPVMPIMAVPIPTTMAWQSPPPMNMMMMPPPPPPMPMPPQRVVFANPHPTAPPIPATALSSKYMTSRDIAFVVHGMLKPILMSENLGTMSTYHLQYWTRHHPVKPPMPTSAVTKRSKENDSQNSKQTDVGSMEIQSRHVKTKEWASERKVLGSTGKTDVTRPRALIAISSSTIQSDTDETKNDTDSSISMKQQRAALWKSRIYCDQAYQCYTAVLDHRWQSSSSTVATSVQPQLLKLTRCLGISVQTVLVDTATGNTSTPSTATTSTDDESKQFRNQYSVDVTVLELLFKLPKGKILLARVLEDALLPPSVVQVLLPVALPTLLAIPIIDTAGDDVTDADDRVIGAWTVVIDTLPTITNTVLLKTVQAIMKQPSSLIVSSTDRMQCTHALLQRGAVMAANDPVFATDWEETEMEFMNLLSSI